MSEAELSGKSAVEILPEVVRHKDLATRKPLRILLAEDNIVNQKVMRGILAVHGYRCDIAADGIEVIDALNRQPYDVIFMDLNMPELDGIAATEMIRSSWPPSQQPHIIALTANALTEDSERCLAAGMDDFIGKPMQMKDFVKAIERVSPNVTDRAPAMSYADICSEPMLDTSSAESVAPIDLTLLKEIATTAGNESDVFLTELITLFLDSTPPLLSALSKGCGENNLAAVRKLAHTLRSPAAQLGAQKLVALCSDLETLPIVDGKRESQVLVQRIIAEYAKVEAALHQALESALKIATKTQKHKRDFSSTVAYPPRMENYPESLCGSLSCRSNA